MVMKLEEVVPFGRSMAEYIKMFALSDRDLEKNILGVGDGPASFNAEMFALGNRVISADPLYVYRAEEIERQFYSVVDNVMGQVKANPSDWVWSYHQSPEHLKAHRVNVLRNFLQDFESGKPQGRYVIGELPTLDFDAHVFDLALCSHFLFLYSEHFPYEFHRASVFEMLRVALEVRIFPLLTLSSTMSPYVERLVEELKFEGVTVSLEKVDYELQRGGNEMLRVRRVA